MERINLNRDILPRFVTSDLSNVTSEQNIYWQILSLYQCLEAKFYVLEMKHNNIFNCLDPDSQLKSRRFLPRILFTRRSKYVTSYGVEWLPSLDQSQVGENLKSSVINKPLSSSGTTSTHIQSICDAMEIPHIETRWDFVVRRDDYSINLYPNPKIISKVTNMGPFEALK